MLSKRSLRILVIADLVLVALSTALAIVGQAWLPEPLRSYEQARSDAEPTARDWVLVAAGIPLILLVLVSAVGLLFLWKPARALYLAAIGTALALTPLAGPFVAAGWAQAINDASLLVSGVVLALIYFSPLRDLFERPKSAATPST